VGITITFLIFWIVLAPQMEKEYLLSLNNILVHTLVPLLFIADFFLFDKVALLHKTEVLWSVAMPLYYFVFSVVNAAVNPKLEFQGGSRYPYFFLDADKNGWFRLRNGMGVFWWAVLFLGLTLGLGYFYRFLQTVL
ncbi:MAG: Pr6Pr family membrane protein, partial [Bacillota bacterium]